MSNNLKQDTATCCEAIASVMEQYRSDVLGAMSVEPDSICFHFLQSILPLDIVQDIISQDVSELMQREQFLDLLLPFENFGAFTVFLMNLEDSDLQYILTEAYMHHLSPSIKYLE